MSAAEAGGSPSNSAWVPYRLMSLGDLMEALRIDLIVDRYQHLLMWGDAAGQHLRANTALSIAKSQYDTEALPKIRELLALIKPLGIPVTTQFVEDFLHAFESAKPLNDGMVFDRQAIIYLAGSAQRLKDIFGMELKSKKFFTMSAQEAELLDPKEPLWGGNFAAQFPIALYDLTEAASCVAMARSTAAVFHLMRIMEIGVRSVARCLKIQDPTKPAERNWGIILGEIKKSINTNWPKPADRMSGDGALFEAIFASLDAVRNPFRNATMHVEKTYTEAEASHMLALVKGFMVMLAIRMDENGEPKI